MRRIAVVGPPGSGKSTLSARLAARFGARHVELDALHWEPNWAPATLPVFRERVAAATAADTWVVDGNYSAVRDLLWDRADTIIWLDYRLSRTLVQLTRRTAGRLLRRTELWSGNRETFANAVFGRDSLYVWAVTTHRRRRRQYRDLLGSDRYRHLHVLRFRSPRGLARWLARVDKELSPPSA